MRAIEVTGPDGTQWRVRRRWAPRHSLLARFRAWRRRRTDEDGGDLGPGGVDLGDDLLVGILLAVAFVVVGLLLAWAVVPLVLLVVDAALVVLLFVVSVLARVLLRRPWTLEAKSDAGRVHTRHVVGWRASGRARRDLAASLANGVLQ